MLGEAGGEDPVDVRVLAGGRLGRAATSPLHGEIKMLGTGRGRVFRNDEITPDVLLASACLPFLHQAVNVDGVFLGIRRLAQVMPTAPASICSRAIRVHLWLLKCGRKRQ